MKKLLLLLSLCWFSSLAVGQPLLMHMAGKGSVQERELQMLGKQLSSNGIKTEYFAPGNCAEPARMWNQAGDRPAIMHYSTTFANQQKMNGKPCTADLTGASVVMVKPAVNWLCGPAKAKPLTTPGLRMGIYMTAPGRDAVADINRLNGFSWRHVPITSTTDGLVALANGDLDYFLVARAGVGNRIETGQLQCSASSVRGDRYTYLETMIKTSGDLETALTPVHVILAKNLSKEQLATLRRLLDPKQNLEFREMLAFENSRVEIIRDNNQTLDQFQRRVNMLLETYKQ